MRTSPRHALRLLTGCWTSARRTVESLRSDLDKDEHKTADFLDVSPTGRRPALVDGELKDFGNAAICLYLEDKYPEAKLLPEMR